MPDIKFKLVTDIDTAKICWDSLSPRLCPYDEWDFRYAFFAPSNFPLAFYAGYINNKLIGLLPLQYNNKNKFLEYFGGDFMEYNHVLIDRNYQPLAIKFYQHVLRQITEKIYLRDFMDGDPILENYQPYDETYYLSLENYQDFEDFLQKKFSSKSRSNIRKKIRQLDKHQIEIIKDEPKDLELLFELNVKRFGSESSFKEEKQQEAFRNLLQLPWEWSLQSFIVDGVKEAVSFSLLYKNIYTYIMAGSNIEKVPNLGSYVVVKALEEAWQKKATLFDAGRNDSGWKNRWHLDKKTLYNIRK
ncbi:GNAT family N-acetyltransferase [Patescibacteria group bacterium]|nr:GNAT family N-acetyltransferase [Patescibacteria group bacterium]